MPNAKVLESKQVFVEELAAKIKSASAGVLVDCKGLNVAQDTKLRRELRAAGIEYSVVKNTMLRFAAQKIGFDALDEHLSGMSALAISQDDPVAAARILNGFAKKNEALKIKAGFVDGAPITADDVRNLADLPSREELVARALGGLNAPISGFVGVLSATMRGLVVALQAIAEKQGGEAA